MGHKKDNLKTEEPNLLKWFGKLTKKEIIAMHKMAVYDKIKDRVDIRGEYFTFYELFVSPENPKGHYIPTTYCMSDYGYEGSHEVAIDDESTDKLRMFMAERFGREYLADLLWYKTGIGSEFFRKIMEKG